MKRSLLQELSERFSQAMVRAWGPTFAERDAMIRPAAQAQFGDYQCNAAMGLAKELKSKPRDVATTIIANLSIDDMCDVPEIAGAGFINLRLKRTFLAERLAQMATEDRLGIEKASPVQRVVVDYSGPNIAKEMHIGHIRSSIIGDSISRVLEFLGHEVVRQNHVGDWGTQFGMLICYLFEQFGQENVSDGRFAIADIEQFYKQAHERYQNDAAFAERSRQMVVSLQSGDAAALRAWQAFRDASLNHCDEIYARLGVKLTRADIRGESFYNEFLADVVNDLMSRGLAVENQGAICIFLDGYKTKEGEPLPMIIRKSDGGFLYATTDLAALRYRVGTLQADRIVYVTDSRQILHFQQLCAAIDLAGWRNNPRTQKPVRFDHVTFGTVLGDNGKPLKTRSGESVKLKDVLDEAITRARAVVDAKNPDADDATRRDIAEAVGVAAVKYADLSNNRDSDYVFSYDKMLSLDGNTAPYLMYAYARIRSIQRKGQIAADQTLSAIAIAEPAEDALAKKLLQLADVLNDVSVSLRPNAMTNYLFELSQAFSAFYESCPVLKADSDAVRRSRLGLCELTARTLRTTLDLLGIRVVEQM
jgi:arginyl-tRNA synthetase